MKSKIRAQSESASGPMPVVTRWAANRRQAEKASLSEQIIRELAYHLYEQRGRLDGKEWQDWFEAESILRRRGLLAV